MATKPAADSLITVYNPGASDLPYRIVLNPVMLIFAGNGNTGGAAPDSVACVKGDAPPLPGYGSLVRTGYAPTSWNPKADGTGTACQPRDTITISTDSGTLTLYAQWTINNYTVAFDSQGGSAVAGVNANYGTTIAAPANPTWTGHNFGGWYKEAGCVNTWISPLIR